MSNLWDLKADPGRIESAATGWRAVAAGVRSGHQPVADQAVALLDGGWSGSTAETYREHLRRLGADVSETAGTADRIAGALDRLAWALRSGQNLLADALVAVTRSMPTTVGVDQVAFRPIHPGQLPLIDEAIAAALEIRAHTNATMLVEAAVIKNAQPAFRAVSASWRDVAGGSVEDWDVPPDTMGDVVIVDGTEVVVSTGGGDDTVAVSVDPVAGIVMVVVNGVTHYLPANSHVTVRTGAGNDTIEVAPGTTVGFTLLGGTGDDTMNGADGADTILGLAGQDTIRARGGSDRVSGGSDRDYLDGGHGNDVLAGGLGDDTAYGMAGNDQISGGEGRDYLEGADGNDTVDGDAGRDMISGGQGDDAIRAGAGSDRVYTGDGRDTVDGGSGDDTAYAQDGDAVDGTEHRVTVELTDLGKYFTIEGSPEFTERVEADLDMLASSPRGQQMLAALDHAHDSTKAIAADWPILGHVAYQGDTYTIRETTDHNSYASDSNITVIKTWSRHPVVQFNPTLDDVYDGPPIAVLYHELAHVYDYEYETLADGDYTGADNPGVHNREREATGLPIDDDGDPSTPIRIDPDHPYDYTENGLRDEMGAPLRPRY
jgi:Ca2+-binding RTX toxin-like protein